MAIFRNYQFARLIFPDGVSRDSEVLKRVREPVTRSKGRVLGKVADVVHRHSLHSESMNEIQGFRVIVACAQADLVQEQPFILEYHDGIDLQHYIPDGLLRWKGIEGVVEIKEDREAESEECQARFTLIEEILGDLGFWFWLWKKSEIFREPRFSNVAKILRYRCMRVSTEDRERVRLVLAGETSLPLARLSETSRVSSQAILRLAIGGDVFIDWWQTLTIDSIISDYPIGQQVWPIRAGQSQCTLMKPKEEAQPRVRTSRAARW